MSGRWIDRRATESDSWICFSALCCLLDDRVVCFSALTLFFLLFLRPLEQQRFSAGGAGLLVRVEQLDQSSPYGEPRWDHRRE